MIGNDVIDLALAQKESNWKRKGFLDKIFTAKEQSHILNSENPELMVWNLWSRKEAAYKIHNRETQIMAYIPHRLKCSDCEEKNGFIYGKVSCYGKIYYTKTKITSEYIETIAVTEFCDFDKFNYLKSKGNVIKINNIPNYYNAETKVLQPMSKSHHGRFEKVVTL